MTDIADLLVEHIKNPESSWSMGGYGAVAEFFQEPGTPPLLGLGLAGMGIAKRKKT